MRNQRRAIFKGLLASLGGLAVFGASRVRALTPSAAEGPYYPTKSMRFTDVDNDLVKVLSAVQEAGGDVITLGGMIKDKDGNPLPGFRIEIWQCDVNGKYLHPRDSRNVAYDTGFQGFGHDITGADGRYTFRTIKPGKYPGRTPHIHVKVFDDSGREVLTTQFYEAGNPENASDSLYRRLSPKQARSVTMQYSENDGRIEATVDVTI